MIKKESTMTISEWEIMRIVWTLGEVTSHQLIHIMSKKKLWTPSTIKTLLSRLQKKGFLIHNGAVRDRLYSPTISEHDATSQTLSQTVQMMCTKCVGPALVNVINETTLTKRDITKLISMLETKKITAPTSIACDCMPKNQEDLSL